MNEPYTDGFNEPNDLTLDSLSQQLAEMQRQMADSITELRSQFAPSAPAAPINAKPARVTDEGLFQQIAEEVKADINTQNAAMLAPLVMATIDDSVKKELGEFATDAVMGHIHDVMNGLDPNAVVQVRNEGLHIVLAKARAYDDVVAQLEQGHRGNGSGSSGASYGVSSLPSRVEDLPVTVRQEIARYEEMTGKTMTTEQLVKMGYMRG